MSKSDEQIGSILPDSSIRDKALADGLSLAEVVNIFLDGYGERPALGYRDHEVIKEGNKNVRSYLPVFKTITYFKLHQRIKNLAMAFRTSEKCRVERDEFVMIMGFADVDYVVVDIACVYAKAVRVPIQSSSSGADLSQIMSNIQPVVMATTIEDLRVTIELSLDNPSVKSIIVFNYDNRVDSEIDLFNEANIELKKAGSNIHLLSIEQVEKIGEALDFFHLPNAQNETAKRTAIIHSSGSTGTPKGAVVNQDAFIYRWIGKETPIPKLTVLLAPLNHIMGRLNLISTLNIGGTGYFTLRPDLSTLIEDIRLVRPTYLSLFPRIFEVVYQDYQNEISRRQKDFKTLLDAAARVKEEMRHTYLGNRLLMIIVGSAPTSFKVREFMQDCFDVLLIDGYGNTESGSGTLTLDGKIVPEVVTDYKLRDVPELGYFTTDLPYPRGEFLVKTKYGIKEYYKQPEATASLFDEEGFSCTGDIVELIGPDEIKVIDRRKDVLKLSHGEYVATGALGTVYEAGSSSIKQIYIYGNSNRSYLLAVVVPEQVEIERLFGLEITTQKVINHIRGEVNRVAQKEGLKKFEVPRGFIIEYDAFSQENGLLSSVRKRLRPALKRKYGADLEAIYKSHEESNDDRLASLKTDNSHLSVLEKLVIIIENQLNIEIEKSQNKLTFSDLGGDSLGAALLSMTIQEFLGVTLSADEILSPTGNIDTWSQALHSLIYNSIDATSFDRIHRDANYIKESELKIDRFVDSEVLASAKDLSTSLYPPKTILITGANGFLGHIVCLEWLQQVAKTGGQIICLIRAEDDDQAYDKLKKEFIGLDEDLENLFISLADKYLRVYAGDISRTQLGLNDQIYADLCASVDRICHVAALVNHRLGYKHLFRPNVMGTAAIIELALTDKKKPIDFISSVGVFMYLKQYDGISEQSELIDSIQLSDKYASGYAASKWAGEILLRQAHELYDIPINTFRCDMILPHRRYRGQANQSDMLSRLIVSIALTGLVPKSFYIKTDIKETTKAHYEGIPVDILAQSIVRAHEVTKDNYNIFHALNYNIDFVSLDSIVEWIESYGYAINRLDSHNEWYRRIQNKLKSLSEEQRNQSMLDILLAFKKPYRERLKSTESEGYQKLMSDLFPKELSLELTEQYIHKYLDDLIALGFEKYHLEK